MPLIIALLLVLTAVIALPTLRMSRRRGAANLGFMSEQWLANFRATDSKS